MSNQRQADMQLVARACNELSEHFDSVLVMVSRHEPTTEDGTIRIVDGRGNWYARFGLAREWVVMQEARAAEAAK
jgi:hypothetical protein